MLGNTFTLEQRMQLSETGVGGGGVPGGSQMAGHGGAMGSGGGGGISGSLNAHGAGGTASGNAMHSLLVHDKGESLLLNLLLPLCLKIGSGRKDSPKMRRTDIQFSMNLLLNLLNPGRVNQNGVNGGGGGGSHRGSAAMISGYVRTASMHQSATRGSANVQYHPAGDARRSTVKTSSLEIGFLGKRENRLFFLLCLKEPLQFRCLLRSEDTSGVFREPAEL